MHVAIQLISSVCVLVETASTDNDTYSFHTKTCRVGDFREDRRSCVRARGTVASCIVAEIVAIDERISTETSPRGRPHWSGSFKFRGHQPQNWWSVAPGPRAERWLKSAREFAGLSMWQLHTKANTQKAETGFEFWWTLLWCLWHPPSLLELFPLGLPFSALNVQRGDHTSKDSQQSVVHHERAPSQD